MLNYVPQISFQRVSQSFPYFCESRLYYCELFSEMFANLSHLSALCDRFSDQWMRKTVSHIIHIEPALQVPCLYCNKMGSNYKYQSWVLVCALPLAGLPTTHCKKYSLYMYLLSCRRVLPEYHHVTSLIFLLTEVYVCSTFEFIFK